MTWRIGILKKLNSVHRDWIYILQTWAINTHKIYIINLGEWIIFLVLEMDTMSPKR